MFKREEYLRQIRPYYDKNYIKVLNGIRKSGKTVIINQIIDELKEKGIKEDHIIYIDFENYDNLEYTYYGRLIKYIKSKVIDSEKYYLFFDEMLNVERWKTSIEHIEKLDNVSIFITTSIADEFLSQDWSRLLDEGYLSFRIQTFSFKEMCELKNVSEKNVKEAFEDYMKWGGFPGRFAFANEEQIISYLDGVYNTIVLKDVVRKNNVQDVKLLEDFMQQVFSIHCNTISKKQADLFYQKLFGGYYLDTIRSLDGYLEYIENSYILNKFKSYDIRDEKKFGHNEHYVEDLGILNLKNLNKKMDKELLLKNLVYNELIHRGYTVYRGVNMDNKIDFVAIKRSEHKVSCYQVVKSLSNEKVAKRVFDSFTGLPEYDYKCVLSLDKKDYSRGKIAHVNLIDWLLDK